MRNKLVTIALACILGTQTMVTTTAMQEEPPASKKLDATQFQIVDESISHINATKRGASILFDSQEELPDTPEKAAIKITGKTWQPNWIIAWGEPSFIIDLGAYYIISDIGYMDMNSNPKITVYDGEPFAWNEMGVLPTNYYNSYRVSHFDSTKPTRYLRVVSQSSDTGINEMGIYGYKVRSLTEDDDKITNAKPAVSKQENLTSGQKIGANAFCDDPFTALAALGNVREYYNWSWLTQKNGQHTFNSIVNKDHYYTTLHEMGISVIPCMQMNSPALLEDGAEWNHVKNTMPVKAGADTLDPASYALHSNMMYNFAARYGNNQNIDTNTLSVGDGDVKIGMNILNTVESWNEQDKTWETKASYFHPYEYAAMLSSDYDGHEGTIANGGVKAADPNFKLAMGGLAGGDKAVQYLSLMKTWFDYNRSDGQFAADVINYHDYITDTQAPEHSDFRENARNIVNWMKQNAPGRDVWLSEFDVIANDKKQAGVNEHDNEAYAKARAERLLRAFLVGEREGLDRMSMFMLRDEWSGAYANSGLTTGKGDWDKKTSWYYLSSTSDTLKNADLIDWQEHDDVYLYTYQDRETSEVIYALWSPTADGSVLPDYQLQVHGEKATIVTPTYGVKEGQKQPIAIKNHAITMDVSETPVFVKVSGDDVPFDSYPQQKIAIQQMRLGEKNGSVDTVTFDNHEIIDIAAGEKPNDDNFMLTQFYHLFDEQTPATTAPTPWQKTRVKPVTEMGAVAIQNEQAYPYDCIVTFDDVYDLTYLGIYDSYATGKMDFYDDVTGDLIYTSNLNTYDCWNLIPLTGKTISTNRIRIVKYNGAKLNELAFYGTPSNRKIGIDVPKQPGVIGQAVSKAKQRLDVSLVQPGILPVANPKLQTSVNDAFQHLFDEQAKMPADSEQALRKGTSFNSNFSNIWGTGASFPYDAVISLKERSIITKAAVYLGWGEKTGKLEIYNQETGELLLSQETQGNGKLVYLPFDKPIETQSLRIVKYNARTLGELSFYGDTLGE